MSEDANRAPASPLTDEALARYLAAMDQQRVERAASVLNAATERERRLMREMAVMGYIQGMWASGGRGPVPADSRVLAAVIAACLNQSDLYPITARMERLSRRRERAVDAEPDDGPR